MTRHIEVVAGAFAIVEDHEVIGVVTKLIENQWGFFPTVPGTTSGLSSYLPLHHCIEEAMKFKRS